MLEYIADPGFKPSFIWSPNPCSISLCTLPWSLVIFYDSVGCSIGILQPESLLGHSSSHSNHTGLGADTLYSSPCSTPLRTVYPCSSQNKLLLLLEWNQVSNWTWRRNKTQWMNGSCKHTGVDVIGESIWSSTGPMEGVTDQCLGGQISTKKFLQVWQLDHVWWNRRYKGLGTMLAKSDSEYSKEISGTVELSGGPRQALQPWATRQEISQEWSPRLGLGPWDKDRTQSLMMDASYEPEQQTG